MRLSRRWTERDLEHLSQQQYGFVHVPPPPLSPEAAEIRLAKIRATRRKLEAVFEQHLTWSGMRALFEAQVKFHPTRQWRLDYFAAEYSLAVELHGGTFSQGKHVRGEGFQNDREKANAAAELNITVLEFTSDMLQNGTAIAQTQRMLLARGWKRQETEPNHKREHVGS